MELETYHALTAFLQKKYPVFAAVLWYRDQPQDLAQTGPVCYALATSLLSSGRTGLPLPSWVQAGQLTAGNCELESLQKAWEGQTSPHPHSSQGMVSKKRWVSRGSTGTKHRTPSLSFSFRYRSEVMYRCSFQIRDEGEVCVSFCQRSSGQHRSLLMPSSL